MGAELARIARRRGLAGYPKPRKDGAGALVVEFSPALASLCMWYHRTSSRVLWDLYSSHAPRLEPLYDDLLSLIGQDNRGYLQQDFTLSVAVRGQAHFAAGERQVVGTVKNAIVDGARARGVQARVDPERPDVHFLVQIKADGQVLVSIDLGGRPMNQRGYRLSGSEAPLKENLAAIMVMLARHDCRTETLVDPMAGTGTLAIEAACLAQGRAVWTAGRTPAGQFLPELRALNAVASPLFPDTQANIIANELEVDRAALITAHADRAQVTSQLTVHTGDFRDLTLQQPGITGQAPQQGLFLCNPPYGERLAQSELAQLYRDLGHYCRSFAGFRTAVLVANDDFERAFGGRPRVKKPLSNGQLRSYFLLYDG